MMCARCLYIFVWYHEGMLSLEEAKRMQERHQDSQMYLVYENGTSVIYAPHIEQILS